MKSLLSPKYHFYVYVFALCLLAVGLPFSKYLMSLAQIILAVNWMLEGDLKNKFSCFLKNKPAVILSSLLLLHFLGLFYTSDFDYAFKDIRIKMPLFILPLIISTSKFLSEGLYDLVLKIFVASVFVGTLVSTFILFGVYKIHFVDTRGVSIFISHIRFALLICVAFFVSIFYYRRSKQVYEQLMFSLLIVWWIIFLILIESLTGLGTLLLTSFVWIIFYAFKTSSGLIRYSSFAIIGIILFIGFYSIVSIRSENAIKETIPNFSTLENYTKAGNAYEHNEKSTLTENGHLIWIYFCDKELRDSWNLRSKIDYNGNDLKGNYLKNTLVRFLTSKGLRKDADAVSLLSTDEIKAIENGIPNVKYQSMSNFKRRIYETIWEIELYKTTGDANGHSLTQRFEYWKTAFSIIKQNTLLGVGTGDIAKAFDDEYIKINSSLTKQWRLRSHNQYLSITVAFGLIGLCWFLFTLIYPAFKLNMFSDFLYVSFFLIAVISFFTEDTLETQAGVTFYAFFSSFFLFVKEEC